MQVVDIQAFSVMFAARSIPDSWSRIYRGFFEPSEGNFIMQVVDNRAFCLLFFLFAVLFIPDSWSRIYRGILSLLREIL